MSNKVLKRVSCEQSHPARKKPASCHCTQPMISDFYNQSDFRSALQSSVVKRESMQFGNGAQFLAEPFPCYVLPNFLSSDEFLEHLENDLYDIPMLFKDNDLYQFKQSEDLSGFSNVHIKTLRDLLRKDILEFVSHVMNEKLTEKVAMTCSVYEYTDVLLCHDDQLEGRKVAFILYLCKNWEKEDGGTLDLFKSANGQPSEVALSVVPEWNKLVFFEVSPQSFHQVAEVLKCKKRISVNGWFHSSADSKEYSQESSCLVSETKLLQSPVGFNGDITSWINPLYFNPEVQIQIRKMFKVQSEIEVPDFLQCSKYSKVLEALRGHETIWKVAVPPNKRQYEEGIDLPAVVRECVSLFQSEAMCLILSNLTGLALHDMASVDSSDSSEAESDSDASCTSETCSKKGTSSTETDAATSKQNNQPCMAELNAQVRKWKRGYYTLLHDQVVSEAELNATMYFGCEGWSERFGGYTAYIGTEDGNELLRVEPKSNSLVLVYTDTETRGFIKYINHRASCSTFFDIFTSYFER